MEPAVSDSGLLTLIAGIFGALIGSFLNVCIVRWPAEQSVIRPRSRCPKCGYQITWYDNIPVLSWLALAGKCRSCRTPIGALYPLVELATALIWAGMVWHFGVTLEAAKGGAFCTILLGIAMTDAREYLIPHEFTIGGFVIGLGFAAAGGLTALLQAVLGGLAGSLPLWALGAIATRVLKKEALGFGDVIMMMMVGAFVGWQGVLLTLFSGSLVGLLIIGPLRFLGRKKEELPFGVFLAIGAALTYLAGPAVVAWYKGFLGGG